MKNLMGDVHMEAKDIMHRLSIPTNRICTADAYLEIEVLTWDSFYTDEWFCVSKRVEQRLNIQLNSDLP